MSQIKISCVGSTAVFTNTPNIFSGGNVDEVKFEFDKEWDNFPGKTAVFYTNPKETALQLLEDDNVAKIPSNMLSQKGKLSIGVIGTNDDGDVKASKILTYIVGKGAVTDDMEITAPTPDIWLQMLSLAKHNQDVVDKMELVVGDIHNLPSKANKDLSNVSEDTLCDKGIAQIYSNSYDGDGSVKSADSPKSLTFPFKPRLLIFTAKKTIGNVYNVADGIIDVSALTSQYSDVFGFNGGTSSGVHCEFKVDGNTVSWYATGSASGTAHMNESGATYYYVAIR